jgi:hypothetical protein
VRAGTKDLGCHKGGKNSSSPVVLPWRAAANLASEQKGHDRVWRLLGLPGEQRGSRRGRHPFYTKGKRGSRLKGFGWGAQAMKGVGPQFPNVTSITIQSSGPPCLKINTQITSDLRLVHSAYVRERKR